MSGSGGDTFGYAGFRVYWFANPAICCSPRLATARAVLHHTPEATMPSTITPEQNTRDTIKHLRWQANAVANLRSAAHLLPAAD